MRADRLTATEQTMLHTVRAHALAKLGRVQNRVAAVAGPPRRRPALRRTGGLGPFLASLERQLDELPAEQLRRVLLEHGARLPAAERVGFLHGHVSFRKELRSAAESPLL